MTKEEIKALVAAKIAGQGSAIDAASVLPDILNGIIDLIPENVEDMFFDISKVYPQFTSGKQEIPAELAIHLINDVLKIRIKDYGALPRVDIYDQTLVGNLFDSQVIGTIGAMFGVVSQSTDSMGTIDSVTAVGVIYGNDTKYYLVLLDS